MKKIRHWMSSLPRCTPEQATYLAQCPETRRLNPNDALAMRTLFAVLGVERLEHIREMDECQLIQLIVPTLGAGFCLRTVGMALILSAQLGAIDLKHHTDSEAVRTNPHTSASTAFAR